LRTFISLDLSIVYLLSHFFVLSNSLSVSFYLQPTLFLFHSDRENIAIKSISIVLMLCLKKTRFSKILIQFFKKKFRLKYIDEISKHDFANQKKNFAKGLFFLQNLTISISEILFFRFLNLNKILPYQSQKLDPCFGLAC